jgi:hypothetical protein
MDTKIRLHQYTYPPDHLADYSSHTVYDGLLETGVPLREQIQEALLLARVGRAQLPGDSLDVEMRLLDCPSGDQVHWLDFFSRHVGVGICSAAYLTSDMSVHGVQDVFDAMRRILIPGHKGVVTQVKASKIALPAVVSIVHPAAMAAGRKVVLASGRACKICCYALYDEMRK